MFTINSNFFQAAAKILVVRDRVGQWDDCFYWVITYQNGQWLAPRSMDRNQVGPKKMLPLAAMCPPINFDKICFRQFRRELPWCDADMSEPWSSFSIVTSSYLGNTHNLPMMSQCFSNVSLSLSPSPSLSSQAEGELKRRLGRSAPKFVSHARHGISPLWVCVYVCMSVCLSVCMYVRMYVCISPLL